MTYREALLQGEALLASAEIADYKNDAWLLMEYACRITRTYYYVHMNDDIPADMRSEYTLLVLKRSKHVPLQYITGEQDFMGLPFKVNSSVLIPRQDTEALVEEALKVIKPGMKVLDMCTGSGCIIISILKNCQGVLGMGADISKEALVTAKENARLNNVTAAFEHSNLFSAIKDKFDVIVSNPPYIPSAVIPTLMPEVGQYEPLTALDGEEDGLAFYRLITQQATGHLNAAGKLLYEIGSDQGREVLEIMNHEGFINCRVIKDLAGNDRVVYGEREN